MATSPGQSVRHYRILERIGAGGMGVVYKADDTNLERTVALKFLPSESTSDPEAKARFVREARAASHLDHPNICTIHEIGDTDDGQTYIAMSFYDGETLKARLDRGPIPPSEALKIAEQIARGLAKAHASGVVHRDIKPANVIVTNDGIVKILDFGLAKLSGATAITRANRVVGTLAYMAPEQLRGEDVGPSADLWSLGVLLFELLTGRRLFAGDSEQAVIYSIFHQKAPELARSGADLPADIDRLLARLLEKDPRARLGNADETVAEIEALSRSIDAESPSSQVAALRAKPRDAKARRRRVATIAVLAAAVVIAAAITAFILQRRAAKEEWVRAEAMPRLQALIATGQNERRDFWDAWLLVREIEAVKPGYPLLQPLVPRYTRKLTIRSSPPGAAVRVRPYSEPAAEPVLLGTTPLTNIHFARGFFRLTIDLPGRTPVEDLLANFGSGPSVIEYLLDPAGSLPEGMIGVPAGECSVTALGYHRPLGEPLASSTAAFLMDRHEVTNREFKRFIDAGGYRQAKFWKQPFVDGARTLSWEEAMTRFTDRTGFPGPSNWDVGSYPEGADELPVGGISWYEAAAYAEWSGKSLPTIYHWNRVASTGAAGTIVPLANYSGKGPRRVDTELSVNRYGASDLAGNVREWTATSWGVNPGSSRFILGGGWYEPGYTFFAEDARSPFDRDAANGFRCIRYRDAADRARLEHPIERSLRDFRAEPPASDATFEIYRSQFKYDRTPLDAAVEEELREEHYVRQKATFRAAYDGPRMIAYLYLPVNAKPPYQAVIIFPGSNAVRGVTFDETIVADPALVTSGRAVIFPIYKGTYERGGGVLEMTDQAETHRYRDNLVAWGKDLSRTIDYLETRSDIDTSRIGYMGWSWGARLGNVLPAVETRIRACVLVLGGFNFDRALPEAEAVNYVSHVKQPTLMLNGHYDFIFPYETSARPMFEMLGTPSADKKMVTYPSGHSLPRTEMIREMLAWFDRYLGPVSLQH